jgi:hypothetical protein
MLKYGGNIALKFCACAKKNKSVKRMVGVSGCALHTKILIGKIKRKSKFENSGEGIYEMQ